MSIVKRHDNKQENKNFGFVDGFIQSGKFALCPFLGANPFSALGDCSKHPVRFLDYLLFLQRPELGQGDHSHRCGPRPIEFSDDSRSR